MFHLWVTQVGLAELGKSSLHLAFAMSAAGHIIVGVWPKRWFNDVYIPGRELYHCQNFQTEICDVLWSSGKPSLFNLWGLCEYVIVHTILGGSPVILWISLGGTPKWLPLKFGYHDVMHTSPIGPSARGCRTWSNRTTQNPKEVGLLLKYDVLKTSPLRG